jgi:hypothetical protein
LLCAHLAASMQSPCHPGQARSCLQTPHRTESGAHKVHESGQSASDLRQDPHPNGQDSPHGGTYIGWQWPAPGGTRHIAWSHLALVNNQNM